MSWNYRIIRHPEGSLALHEVHYDDAGTPRAVSARPASFATDFGDDDTQRLEDLRGSLTLAAGAFEKPVLDLAAIGGPIPEQRQ